MPNNNNNNQLVSKTRTQKKVTPIIGSRLGDVLLVYTQQHAAAKKSDVFILNFSSGKFKGISFAIGKKKFININFG